MRKRMFTFLLIAGITIAGAGLGQAAGFNIYEAGVRATALGGAFTATADDGSALFYNPAGLSFIDGTTVNMNAMSVAPRFKFAGATTAAGPGAMAEAEHKGYFVPGMYYTQNNGGRFAWGAGLYAPFGLGVEWMNPESFVGRQISYDVGIQTIYVTPAVSYKVSNELAISLGLDIAVQHLKLQKFTLNPTDGSNAIDTTIEGRSDPNVTLCGGLMYRPVEELSFGLMYHHKKTLKYEVEDGVELEDASAGDSRSNFPTTLLGVLGGPEHDVATDFNLPNFLSAGLKYRFHPRFAAEFNYVWFGWSEFEKLDMLVDDDPESALSQELHFGYEDVWQIRVGAEYILEPGRWILMAGYVYDNTPQPLDSVSPLLPDSDRNDYSVGVQFQTGDWDVFATYMAVIGDERTNIENGERANPDEAYPVGTYKTLANIYGVGATYRF